MYDAEGIHRANPTPQQMCPHAPAGAIFVRHVEPGQRFIACHPNSPVYEALDVPREHLGVVTLTARVGTASPALTVFVATAVVVVLT